MKVANRAVGEAASHINTLAPHIKNREAPSLVPVDQAHREDIERAAVAGAHESGQEPLVREHVKQWRIEMNSNMPDGKQAVQHRSAMGAASVKE